MFCNRRPPRHNPWKRHWNGPPHPVGRLPSIVNGTKRRFGTILDANRKKAVLKVSPSVVALVSYSGGKETFWCSGVIFGSYWLNDSLNYYVLTSATLLRPPSSHASDLLFDQLDYDDVVEPEDDPFLPMDQSIDVLLRRGKLYEGTVVTYDHHYNIAVLTFKSDDRIPCAILRPLDDTLALNNAPTNVHAVKLIPTDAVIAVGRFTEPFFQIMASPGRYHADCFDEKTKLDCFDLFTADCKISKCGIGGPLISHEGEVIGLNFYAEKCTPFLPINIFLKWWFHHKVTRSHCRPSLGMKVANLHTADVGILGQVQKLGISQGVIVEKVVSGSPAESCDLHPGDVVFKCHDTMVVSPLQLFEIIWDMAGKIVEVAVIKDGSYENLKIEVKDLTSADEFYQWPLPTAYTKYVKNLGRDIFHEDVLVQQLEQFIQEDFNRPSGNGTFSSVNPPIVNEETIEQVGQDSQVHEVHEPVVETEVAVEQFAKILDVPMEAAVKERIDSESDGDFEILSSTVMNDSYARSASREAKHTKNATRRKAAMQKTPSRDRFKRLRKK